MVDAKAFRGLEFDASKVELGKVVAPPFDVINESDLERLKKQTPYNVTHLTLPKPGRGAKTKDPYEHAAQLLEKWREEGVLRQPSEDTVYAYEIWHRVRAEEKRMRGVVVALKLDPTYKQVVPHERIFEKPAEDRLKLLRATGVDLEPIWLLYSGKTIEATMWAYLDGGGRSPDLLVTSKDGTIHKVWRVNDEAVVGTVIEGLKGRKAYIADGHHRYATAVKYAEERRLQEYRPNRNAAYEYKMVLLTNMSDPGLGILPTHRVVKVPKKVDAVALRKSLEPAFHIETRRPAGAPLAQDLVATLNAKAGAPGHSFGAYLGGDEYWLVSTAENLVPEDLAPGRSFTWRSLDVSFLQKVLLERHVGVPEKRWGDDVYYTRDAEEAVKLVATGKAGIALFHLPTKLAQLRAIADGGEVMPQKSTFFAPKPLSGLVMHPIGKPVVVEGPPKRRFTS